MKKLLIFGFVTFAFLAFTSSTAFAEEEEDPCELLQTTLCEICGDESDACKAMSELDEATPEECTEVIVLLGSVAEEVEKMDEESQAVFVEEFCKELGAE